MKNNFETSDVGVNEDGFLTVDDRATTIEGTNFLYNLQQTNKRLHDTDYEAVLERIDFSPSFFADCDTKKLLQPAPSRTTVKPKIKTPRKAS